MQLYAFKGTDIFLVDTEGVLPYTACSAETGEVPYIQHIVPNPCHLMKRAGSFEGADFCVGPLPVNLVACYFFESVENEY